MRDVTGEFQGFAIRFQRAFQGAPGGFSYVQRALRSFGSVSVIFRRVLNIIVRRVLA